MKPRSTVADFIRRGRDAGQDALGIALDPEAVAAMAATQRGRFLRERTQTSLRRWRELVAEVASSDSDDPALARWLGIEYVRLGCAFKALSVDDAALVADAARWIATLDSDERGEVAAHFELDLRAPLTL